MKLLFPTKGPVQEIAAEQATLARFVSALNTASQPAPAAPVPVGLAGFGVPVVVDPALPPGEVHFRPLRQEA